MFKGCLLFPGGRVRLPKLLGPLVLDEELVPLADEALQVVAAEA